MWTDNPRSASQVGEPAPSSAYVFAAAAFVQMIARLNEAFINS
jgi:hypothetical protein